MTFVWRAALGRDPWLPRGDLPCPGSDVSLGSDQRGHRCVSERKEGRARGRRRGGGATGSKHALVVEGGRSDRGKSNHRFLMLMVCRLKCGFSVTVSAEYVDFCLRYWSFGFSYLYFVETLGGS